MGGKKILIIRAESTLIRLLFSFFPDTYIHDINLEQNDNLDKKLIILSFLFYKDRGIAIGNNGSYIKIVNFIFNNYLHFYYMDRKYFDIPIEIRCEFINL